MCSQSSVQLADCEGALFAAVTDVAENSLFAFADASGAEAFEAAAVHVDGPWHRASVQFAGPFGGRFELTAPEVLTRRLCIAFSGALSPDEIGPDDLTDFTGELVNMFCGTWLTRVFPKEAFDLTSPQVTAGRPDDAPSAGASGGASGTFYLAIDDAPIRIRVRWRAVVPEGA